MRIGINQGPANTPEHALVAYLSAWQSQDWHGMEQATNISWRRLQPIPIIPLRNWYADKRLKSIEIVTVDPNPDAIPIVKEAATDITFKGTYILNGKRHTKLFRARVLLENEQAALVDKTSDQLGKWGVNPLSTLREWAA